MKRLKAAYTLIELMVIVVIAFIVLALCFNFFSSCQSHTGTYVGVLVGVEKDLVGWSAEISGPTGGSYFKCKFSSADRERVNPLIDKRVRVTYKRKHGTAWLTWIEAVPGLPEAR